MPISTSIPNIFKSSTNISLTFVFESDTKTLFFKLLANLADQYPLLPNPKIPIFFSSNFIDFVFLCKLEHLNQHFDQNHQRPRLGHHFHHQNFHHLMSFHFFDYIMLY